MDDEQLVYLQKLVLVSNEAVAAAFRVYEEGQDLVRLAESLKQVCLDLFVMVHTHLSIPVLSTYQVYIFMVKKYGFQS